MAILAGHPEALRRDGGTLGLDDLSVLNMAPELERLLLALFLLAADVGDAVIHHLRPALEGLAGAGNGLIGAHQHPLQPVLAQGMQGRNIALEGAVALHGHKAPLGAQTLALGVDDGDMLGVDLRHHHGDILRPAVGGVVGDDGALQLGVLFLQSPDFLFLHVHGAETKIYHVGQLLGVRLGIQHHQIPGCLRHGGIQGPSACHGLPVGLAGAAAAGSHGGQTEPGVMLQQRDESLSHHARAADDAYFVLFHIHASSRFLCGPDTLRCPPSNFG